MRDYAPAQLDELLATGEFLWTGTAAAAGNDGWVAFHHVDSVDLSLVRAEDFEPGPVHRALQEVLDGGGAWFFGPLAGRVREGWAGEDDRPTNADVLAALWDLVWAGRVGNDTLAPIRGLLGQGRTAHKSRARTPRARPARPGRGARLSRLRRLEEATGSLDAALSVGGAGPTGSAGAGLPAELGPTGAARAAGRWSLLPVPATDPTLRAHSAAEYLLDRYGVITRGSVVAEEVPGGFATQYRLLTRMEEAGQVRRGYYIEHLGAAQFSTGATVDRLRGFTRRTCPSLPRLRACPWPPRPVATARVLPPAPPPPRRGRRLPVGRLVLDATGTEPTPGSRASRRRPGRHGPRQPLWRRPAVAGDPRRRGRGAPHRPAPRTQGGCRRRDGGRGLVL